MRRPTCIPPCACHTELKRWRYRYLINSVKYIYKNFSPFDIRWKCVESDSQTSFLVMWMRRIVVTSVYLTYSSSKSPYGCHQTNWMLLVQISWFLLIGGKMSHAFKQKNYFSWEFYNFFCWWRLNGKNVTLSCIFQKKLSSNKKVNFQLSPLCILILFAPYFTCIFLQLTIVAVYWVGSLLLLQV